jgi:hypothetical protein
VVSSFGGSSGSAVQVATVVAAPTGTYIGCYLDNYSNGCNCACTPPCTSNRQIPYNFGNGYTIASCAAAATARGYNIFAMQNQQQCLGCLNCNAAALLYPTSASDCPGNKGGRYINSVYSLP